MFNKKHIQTRKLIYKNVTSRTEHVKCCLCLCEVATTKTIISLYDNKAIILTRLFADNLSDI